ncbi:flagellar biosynthesis anti-sigma factor FlgM [Oceanobacillus jeddahense]|uniref:Negative regulator of flagellin synthesis n=1 Tax=Oceanobacillus jeddahense TaxID=1462527 RepID=A0ABY5JQT5_9BACI|nr:flagellar biosynthesis anti-sigma factor FlgM [Oceanobacillus jeddahense]UUI02155.1 flagellar biosynthesis anti-sigma factor FlgM [Oceanobacillus jeddahense]
MKIHGPNPTNFNPYKQVFKDKQAAESAASKKDSIEISNEAKKLQKQEQPNEARAAYVNEIKQKIENNQYEINYDKVARKMHDFWTGK